MRYLFDTNSCIYLFAGSHPHLTARVEHTPAGTIALSVIVFAELALGCRQGKGPAVNQLARLREELPLLPFEEADAQVYAMLPFRRGSFDRLLAAHALSRRLTLVTNNEADFADVPGLAVENWTVPA